LVLDRIRGQLPVFLPQLDEALREPGRILEELPSNREGVPADWI